MNRHYFNFIAMFNAALKTKRMNFVMPLRNKFILNFLNILLKKGLIDAYAFENKRPPLDSPFLKLGRRRTNFYYPIKVFFKPGLLEKILSISTPGKYRSLTRRDLDRYVRLWNGANGIVLVSSSRLKKICDAKEVLPLGEGGLVVCVIILAGKAI